ncbi:protein zwilch [Bacillus rossius redtenbacheri]|uniref:protein zwilch n=1 Tax=Bacillus rossius redtenbacheri TaxID=93214 RepID=UPI002FDD4EA5
MNRSIIPYRMSDNEPRSDFYVDTSPEIDHDAGAQTSLHSETGPEYTGNPLECPFGDDDYDPTITGVTNCWHEEEESHLPLPLSEARGVLSAFNLRHSDEEDGTPCAVWVVCAEPGSQTVLLSGSVRDGWCASGRARWAGSVPRGGICEAAAVAQLQHLAAAGTSRQELSTEVVCTYNIHGDSSAGSKQYVGLEVKWANTVTLNAPVYDADAVVILKATVGEEDSPVHALWAQLNALASLADWLEAPQEVARRDDSRLTTAAVRDRISSVLREVTYKLGVRPAAARGGEAEGRAPGLEQLARTVAGGSRPNRDLMDVLWLLLCDCRDSEELALHLSMVLNTIKSEGCKYNIHPSYRGTRLARLIAGLGGEGGDRPRVAPAEACELLQEVGAEKLSRDYWFLLLESELLTADQLQHSTRLPASAGPGEEASGRLALLGQLHCVTELLLLAGARLSTTHAALRRLGARACRRLLPARRPFRELARGRGAALRCGVPVSHVQAHISPHFSRYRVSFATRLPLREVQTTFLCSLEQIFPSNIMSCPDESSSSEQAEDTYYCYELLENKNKLT